MQLSRTCTSRVVALASLLAATALSGCCEELFDHFEWHFADSAPTEWEVLEGDTTLGTAAVDVETSCWNATGDDATCHIATLRIAPDTAPGEGHWNLAVASSFPDDFGGDLSGLEVDTTASFVPPTMLCFPKDGNRFLVEPRVAQIENAIWTASGDFERSAALHYDITMEVPPVDPETLVDFPDCPNERVRLRLVGTVTGRRKTVTNTKCPTSN